MIRKEAFPLPFDEGLNNEESLVRAPSSRQRAWTWSEPLDRAERTSGPIYTRGRTRVSGSRTQKLTDRSRLFSPHSTVISQLLLPATLVLCVLRRYGALGGERGLSAYVRRSRGRKVRRRETLKGCHSPHDLRIRFFSASFRDYDRRERLGFCPSPSASRNALTTSRAARAADRCARVRPSDPGEFRRACLDFSVMCCIIP